jgi:chemotaxis protein methyltransferase CheR
MKAAVFRAFCEIAQREAGIDLREGKEALVATRIGKRLRALGLADEAKYLEVLERDRAGEEMRRFLDAISTNFTSFYREPEHFALVRDLARARMQDGARKLRVWCAAAATGEEPWTLALVLGETLGLGFDWRILATDISERALDAARAARYDARRLGPVPPSARDRWFSRVPAPEPTYEVDPGLREKVSFARLNLATPPFPMSGPFDLVMCRNVMIYLSQEVRQGIVSECDRLLSPGGLLVIGHSETLGGISSRLRARETTVHEKPR